MLNCVEYWDSYYNSNKEASPSNFACFCSSYLQETDGYFLDFGCGNGRDSLYFHEKNQRVVAVDKSANAINNIRLANKDILCINGDVNSIPVVQYSYIYSRWVLHSVSKKDQNIILKKFRDNIKSNGLLFIECRSINDSLYGVGDDVGDNGFINTHYRRFIEKDALAIDLTNTGFKILYIAESNEFSVVEQDKPCLIRTIATPK